VKLALILAAGCVSLVCVAPAAARTHPHVPARQDVADRSAASEAVPTQWLKSLARRYFAWKEEHEGTDEVAKQLLEAYLENDKCSSLLPAMFFCPAKSPPPLKPPRAFWGSGFALSWHGASPGSWSAPRMPRHVIRALTPGVLYSLTCWASGSVVTDGGIVTKLWYRLPGGGWVNDGWVDTGTNGVIPGVAHC
jgi:hypothetical protein